MARPRKPTAILELNGAFKANPQRRRDGEPQDSRPLGDPPERLPVDARQYWKEIAEMVPPGVLKFADRWAVEIAANLMWKFARRLPIEAMTELVNTLEMTGNEARKLMAQETITGNELSILSNLLGRLGMTPADRSKLSIPTEKPKNKFEELLRVQ